MEITQRIPVMRPLLPTAEAISPFLKKIDSSRIYSNFGPVEHELTLRLAHHFNVDSENVLLVASGTLALQAAVATGSQTGSRWIVPSWTFVATAQAVLLAGSTVEFEDVDVNLWSLNPDKSRDVDGVMTVAPFGGQVRIEDWIGESSERPVIIDAASCFDACRDLSSVQKNNIAVMVSLHATKLVTTGEGGVIVGPRAWISEMKRWINFGFLGDRKASRTGTNAKLSEYQAAIGLASLAQWDRAREEWSERIKKLSDNLAERDISVQPAVGQGYVTSTLVALFGTAAEKSEAILRLAANNIESRDWWGSGVHREPAFESSLLVSPRNLVVTEDLAARTLGVPLYVDMSDRDIDRILIALS